MWRSWAASSASARPSRRAAPFSQSRSYHKGGSHMQAEGYIHGITTHSDAALREELDIKYGRVKRREKKDVLGRDADELIALQAKLGFKRVSDGQLLWPDLFRPAYLLMEGVTIGSQTRWFATNGFAFTPLLDGKLSTRSADLSPVLFREKIPSTGDSRCAHRRGRRLAVAHP